MSLMNRREFFKATAMAVGGVVVGGLAAPKDAPIVGQHAHWMVMDDVVTNPCFTSWGIGFKVSEEAWNDDLYNQVSVYRAAHIRAMARSLERKMFK